MNLILSNYLSGAIAYNMSAGLSFYGKTPQCQLCCGKKKPKK
ncbi:hypothetical protein [Anabaena sp. UHCC 0253]|nr:hypothetical protein [Anabaena sp. UHCC 0253]